MQFKEIENVFNVSVSFQLLIDQQLDNVQTGTSHIVTRETKSFFFSDNQFLIELVQSKTRKMVVGAFCVTFDKSCDIHKLQTFSNV